MKYRIKVEKNRKGEKRYTPQKKYKFWFWEDFQEVRDITMQNYGLWYNTLKKAKQAIKDDIENKKQQQLNKISKRWYINI